MVLISNQFTNLVLISTQQRKTHTSLSSLPSSRIVWELDLPTFYSSSYNKFCFLFSTLSISIILYSCWHCLFFPPSFSLFSFLLLSSTSLLSLFFYPTIATSQGPVPSQTLAFKRASARQHWSPQSRTHWRDFHRSRQPWQPYCATTAHPNKDRVCPCGCGLQRREWIDSTNIGRPQRAQGRCVHTTPILG